MVFEFGESVNDLIDKLLDGPGVLMVAENPIYTAAVIVLVLMFIVLIVFRDAETEESLFGMVIRTGFWVFLATTGILMLHNKVLMNKTLGEKKLGQYEEVFRPSTMLHEDIVPVPVHRDHV